MLKVQIQQSLSPQTDIERQQHAVAGGQLASVMLQLQDRATPLK